MVSWNGTRLAQLTRGRQSGFTLIEVLVVVTIMAILMGLLLAAISSVWSNVRILKCKNNMRQIGIAMANYCATKRGYYPKTAHTMGAMNIERTWIYTLAPFMDDIDEVRICPADPKKELRLAAKGTSYVMNEYITVPGPHAALRLYDVESTSHTITVFTGSDRRGVGPANDHTHSRYWFEGGPKSETFARVLQDVQVDRFYGSPNRPVEERTSGFAHYLFADGRVQRIDALAIFEHCENGFNFAKPQRGAWPEP